MNILIVGNGFDLAHGLKTSYGDFLTIVQTYGNSKVKLEDDDKSSPQHFCFEQRKLLRTVYSSNVFKYMYLQLNKNKGWIDFENEIHDIVDDVCELPQYLVERRSANKGSNLHIEYRLEPEWAQQVSPFIFSFMERYIRSKNQGNTKIDIKQINHEIFLQIQNFIELFRRYICWLNYNKLAEVKQRTLFSKLLVDHYISFNYTNTGPAIYGDIWKLDPKNICYVHGQVQDDSQNHIVMGIGSDFYDPYKHTDFLPFFKFYQCYKYKTDMSYLKWLPKEVRKRFYSNPGYDVDCSDEDKCNIYIYGHSLDPTDENILLPFFDYGPENLEVKIYIYYLNGSSLLEMEKNLVKILGREKFERYFMGENPKIQFRPVT